MNEITKLYENANVRKDWNSTPYGGIEEYYPPFTAEKQIGLITWLIQNNISDERIIRSNYEKTYYYCLFTWEHPFYESEAFTKYEEALAYIFNYLWQDLTEEEHKQVKGILE